MKPAQIFHQYIWIINTLRTHRKLTFEELHQKWQDDDMANGIEVLEPQDLREKMRQMIADTLKRY